MTEERTTPLRERMIEDMRIRGLGEKSQKAHSRAIRDFARFLGRSPDTATPEDLRAYQLHMADTGVTPTTSNARIVALRFFFGMTCGREDMKRYMQFRTEPRKLPVVLSVEEVSDICSEAILGCCSTMLTQRGSEANIDAVAQGWEKDSSRKLHSISYSWVRLRGAGRCIPN